MAFTDSPYRGIHLFFFVRRQTVKATKKTAKKRQSIWTVAREFVERANLERRQSFPPAGNRILEPGLVITFDATTTQPCILN